MKHVSSRTSIEDVLVTPDGVLLTCGPVSFEMSRDGVLSVALIDDTLPDAENAQESLRRYAVQALTCLRVGYALNREATVITGLADVSQRCCELLGIDWEDGDGVERLVATPQHDVLAGAVSALLAPREKSA